MYMCMYMCVYIYICMWRPLREGLEADLLDEEFAKAYIICLSYLQAEKRSTPQQQHGVRSRLKFIFCAKEFSENEDDSTQNSR